MNGSCDVMSIQHNQSSGILSFLIVCNPLEMSTALSEQLCYTLINSPTDSEQLSDMQIKDALEKGELKAKIDVLKKLIYAALNGDKVSSSVLMYVIRFCLPSQDHLMKKLLLVFWEVVPKTSPDGKLLHEMILVCDAYRKDLQHPNEFVRGSTLRFLCKLKEPELIEPLMPAIRTCLEHRHSYVRRNAALAVYTIYKNFPFLIPDAPELVYNFLEVEQDASCKRNAFIMLIQVDQKRALDYLSGCIDQVTSFGDILQLIIVELIYKVCYANPNERSRFIRCVYNLLQSNSPAVRYEAAGTLITLSTAPTALKAAAQCYIDLIVKESDNNVKLIVLDRLVQLRNSSQSEKVLQELVIDILRVLSSPDLEVRRKTLNLALDLVSSRNVDEMVMFLRKEISKTTNVSEQDDTAKYRQNLVRTLHAVTIKFPDVASNVMPLLMEFLSDTNDLASGDVLLFVREAIQRLPDLRPVILCQLMDVFPQIRSLKTFRSALWILGEYCSTLDDIQSAMTLIRQSLDELPLVDDEFRLAAANESAAADDRQAPPLTNNVGGAVADDVAAKTPSTAAVIKRLVTADGTYATQSALSVAVAATGAGASSNSSSDKSTLRKFLLDGEFFTGASLGAVLCKLATRFQLAMGDEASAKLKVAHFSAECMYVIACIIHLGKSGLPKTPITEDDVDRLCCSLRCLGQAFPLGCQIFAEKCRQTLNRMLDAKKSYDETAISTLSDLNGVSCKKHAIQTDDPVPFGQLLTKMEAGLGNGMENLFDLSLSQALGVDRKAKKFDLSSSKLGQVNQLSGFSDPVYAECYVNVNQYDIVLDVLIVNQTADTLENLCLELATLGDLRLVEKPPPLTMAPHDFVNVKASVKVASTENGIIFGTIVYDVRGATGDRNCVYLNDVHVDIIDYIVPATCTDQEFRQMWADFEWENKVVVNTPITDLRQYLIHVAKSTNMKCLTMDEALAGDCGFLAANFYAHSIFGEDALANLSIEKSGDEPNSPVTGHIRIRAKSQGMALSLGDKVNTAQKIPPKLQQSQISENELTVD